MAFAGGASRGRRLGEPVQAPAGARRASKGEEARLWSSKALNRAARPDFNANLRCPVRSVATETFQPCAAGAVRHHSIYYLPADGHLSPVQMPAVHRSALCGVEHLHGSCLPTTRCEMGTGPSWVRCLLGRRGPIRQCEAVHDDTHRTRDSCLVRLVVALAEAHRWRGGRPRHPVRKVAPKVVR